MLSAVVKALPAENLELKILYANVNKLQINMLRIYTIQYTGLNQYYEYIH